MSEHHSRSSDLEKMGPALAVMHDLEAANGAGGFEFLVPPTILVGKVVAWGYPVRHIPGIDCVFVARRAELGTRELL